MNIPRRRRLSRRDAELLLDGLPVRDDLHQLLQTVRDAGHPSELPGEAAALAAFRSGALADLVTDPGSQTVPTLTFSRSLAMKIAIASTAVVATAGAAAAATGTLPTASHHKGSAAAATSTASSTASSTFTHTGTAPAKPTGTAGAGDHDASTHHLVALCLAWTAHKTHPTATGTHTALPRPTYTGTAKPTFTHTATATSTVTKSPAKKGKKHHKPSFAVLIKAAGGESKVATFCQSLLASVKKPTGTAKPTHSAHATTKPTFTKHPTATHTKRSHPTATSTASASAS